MVARRIGPPVECPTCGSPVPEAARFCPVCERPRRAVEQQLRDAAETTGTPYETLLEQELDEDARSPQPFVASVGVIAQIAAMSSLGKIILGSVIGILFIYISGSIVGALSDDSTYPTPRLSVTSGSSRPTATRSQQSSTSSTTRESTYTSAIQTITSDMASSMVRFSRLAENPRIGNSDWTVQVAAELVTWDTNYRELQSLSPPPRFSAAHSKILQSMRELTSAADDIAAGIDTNNADRIKQGTAKIERAGQLMEEAVDLMP